jgi:2-amino-4-hydroxy-6-hydroxymethyldihydropteridine diphosphokinase
MGSNLGGSHEHLLFAEAELSIIGRLFARSSIYQTTPVGGPLGQPLFLNAVVVIEPDGHFARHPERVLEVLLDIECRRGRVRRGVWSPRTLDLDLVSLGDLVVDQPGLKIPHPRAMERAFVLTPLCEVDSEWTHPVTAHRACEVLIQLEKTGVVRTELNWGMA